MEPSGVFRNNRAQFCITLPGGYWVGQQCLGTFRLIYNGLLRIKLDGLTIFFSNPKTIRKNYLLALSDMSWTLFHQWDLI